MQPTHLFSSTPQLCLLCILCRLMRLYMPLLNLYAAKALLPWAWHPAWKLHPRGEEHPKSPSFTHAPIPQRGLGQASIRVQSYSMGPSHPSFQLTGAVCLATALNYKGTVAAELAENPVDEIASHSSMTLHNGALKGSAMENKFEIADSKGVIEVLTTFDVNGEVQGCAVSRTARKLFEGNVSYYI